LSVGSGRSGRTLARSPACRTSSTRPGRYQDPKTKAPTTYKIECTLHRKQVREGTWSVVRDKGAVVYHLANTKTEADLFLLKGGDNVLFFLGQDRKPLVGHDDFSYTLNWCDTTKPDR